MKKLIRRLLSVVAIATTLTCQVALLTLPTMIAAPQPALAAQDYGQSQSYSPSKKQKDYGQTQSSDYGNAKQQASTQEKQYAQQDQSSPQTKSYAQQGQSTQSQQQSAQDN